MAENPAITTVCNVMLQDRTGRSGKAWKGFMVLLVPRYSQGMSELPGFFGETITSVLPTLEYADHEGDVISSIAASRIHPNEGRIFVAYQDVNPGEPWMPTPEKDGRLKFGTRCASGYVVKSKPSKDSDPRQPLALTPAQVIKIRQRLVAIFACDNPNGLADMLILDEPESIFRIDWNNAIVATKPFGTVLF